MQCPFLERFWANPAIRNAVISAAREYCGQLYINRNSSLRYQNSDGIALHGLFNRMLADHLARYGPDQNMRFIPKKRDEELDISYIYDVVASDPYKGQQRFVLMCHGQKFQAVHMKGGVDGLYLKVAGIGKARKEYLRNQSKAVPQRIKNLFDMDEGMDGTASGKEPIRIILVTEIAGPDRNDFRLLGCVHDGRFDQKEGLILLSEAEVLLEDKVSILAQPLNIEPKPKQNEDDEFGFDISRKQA